MLKGAAGWGQVLRDIAAEISRNHVSMMAAAIAFYALLSIFPGLSALISLYGLVANPMAVTNLVSALGGILPREAVGLISHQLYPLVHAPPVKLSLAFFVSLALTVWSAMSGTSMVMQALTIARQEKDRRGIIEFYLVAAALTAGLILFGVLALLLVAVFPTVLGFFRIPAFVSNAISAVRWLILAVGTLFGLQIVYRFAPDGNGGRAAWISLGAVVATALWLVGSAAFSLYVAHFDSYDKTYGSLGAVIVLMIWFYLTAFTILAGAEFDVAVERRRRDMDARS
jgi:membrane protein